MIIQCNIFEAHANQSVAFELEREINNWLKANPPAEIVSSNTHFAGSFAYATIYYKK